MKKVDVMYWVDILLLLAFVVVGVTGLVKFFFFLNGRTFGLPVRSFNKVHDYAGVVMVVAAAVHLLLHWNWLICMTKRKLGIGKKICEVEK